MISSEIDENLRDKAMAAPLDQFDEEVMSFGEHLEELRRRLLLALAAPLPISVLMYFVSDSLIVCLLQPVYRALRSHNLPEEIQALSPPEVIAARIKMSLIAAVIFSAPWILWQGWQFIRPGLFQHERRFVFFLIPGSAILTLTGVALMYYAMLPLMLHVLISIGTHLDAGNEPSNIDARVVEILAQEKSPALLMQEPRTPEHGDVWWVWPDLDTLHVAVHNDQGEVEVLTLSQSHQSGVSQQYRLRDYINFVLLLFLGITIAFQMPLVVLLLGWLGLASVDWLRKYRPYAIFTCGVVSAMITPPDVISMFVMFIPLYALYELGILLLIIVPASAIAEGRMNWRRPPDQSQ